MFRSRSPAIGPASDVHAALTGHHKIAVAKPQHEEALLLTAAQAADLLGMSERQFHKLRPGLPAPVVLGPRHVRWRRSDLSAWVLGLTPTEGLRPEPTQLRAGKLRKSRSPGGELADSACDGAETQGRRGVRQRMSPSNCSGRE
jgi:predicted DNA-binding transcriptional regulator AlpA